MFKSKIRIDHENDSKEFYIEREVESTIIRNMDGIEQPLYRLPQLLFGISINQIIFLVEGENDVVILYDNDKAGIKRKQLLCNITIRKH